ncbi:MAG: KOW domain-containing RNA-binding protein [Lachnospiraceae bacterium]|nr:KOW domain-containing RNA-binding protein [Lachnospiraceae bacterium]MDD7378567.1 KOW domain-containing RNA-binding protein [Lachnospiraceae bacterium]MDY4616325.1 KOW domain-containing RNA-binding protein [Lachnospiraceae bacterium]
MDTFFAKTKAGHDKNQIYFLLKKDEEYVYLVNGTTKPLEKPKKKNRKHIQLIKNLPIEVTEVMEAGTTNENVKRAIKIYQKLRQESEDFI